MKKKPENLAVIIKFPTGDKHFLRTKFKSGYRAKIIPIKRVIEMKAKGFDPGLMGIELSNLPIIEVTCLRISKEIMKEMEKYIKNMVAKQKQPFLRGDLRGSFSIKKDKKDDTT